MGRIKQFIFKDVKNEDESSKPAIVLRLAAIGMMAYCFLLAVSVAWGSNDEILMFSVPCFMLYGTVFWLTYQERVKAAAYGLNVLTIIWILLCIHTYGWDLGVQHFLFVLILIDFFLQIWKISTKLIYVAALCSLRIALFFYCRFNQPLVQMAVMEVYYYQVVNTISIFAMVSCCGCLINSNFLNMEQKLLETNKKLRHLAGTDSLTQLMNRMCMVDYVKQQMKKTDNEKGMSVAIGDIDYFKQFNDTYGHECGDAVLKTLAELFKKSMQPYGAVARWGGEEFLFLFKESNGDEAYVILSQLRSEVKKLDVDYDGLKLKVNMTFGLVEIDKNQSFDASIREADDLLYYGKERGRDQIVY